MKKIFYILMGLAISLILIQLISCKKNRLNLNDLDSIEGSGEWVLPLLNAQYHISDILTRFDKEGFIDTSSDGSLKYVYELTQENLLKASDLLIFDNTEQIDDFPLDNPSPGAPQGTSITLDYNQPLSFDTTLVEVVDAVVNTGLLHVTITHDIYVDEYDVTISTDNIKTSTGDDFYRILESEKENTTNFDIDLANYSVVPFENNSLMFHIGIHFQSNGATTPEYNIHTELHLSNFSIKRASAYVAAYSMPLAVETPFNLFSSNYGGDIFIYEPRLVLYTKNSFDVDGVLQVDVAEFSGPDITSSLLETSPAYITIPVSPNDYTPDNIEEISAIHLNSQYNQFKATGIATLNPDGFAAGPISVSNTSTISVKVAAEVPFNFLIEEAYYRDTTDLNLNDIGDVDHIEELNFRVVLTNGIPLDIDAQIIAYDSVTNTMVDSLFVEPEFLNGAYDGNPVVHEPITIHITNERIHDFLNANKLILRFKIETEGNKVTLYSDNFLGAVIGVSIKYSGADIDL